MRIRQEQVDALNQAPMRVFEDDMVVHLAEFSPPLFNAVKEEQLRKAIHFGISRADEYGFTFRGPIEFYLELMLLFGSHFDTDPQYPWASEILKQEDGEPQMERAQLIYEKTREYREKVAGPRDKYTLKALRSISEMAQKPLPITAENFAPAMLSQMAQVYPQKTDYVGADQLNELIDEGLAAAQRYGFSSDRARALPVVLMFAFGHGCFDDPLYPWIAKTVNDGAITDPEARAKRLEKKALTWLDHVLAYFDKDEKA
jgi:hypothetical protein